MKTDSFFKHAAVYGVAGMLTQSAGFVLLPLYTRYLTPGDYGDLEVLGRVAETAATCLLIGGFRQALLTFYQQADGEEERRRVFGTALTLVATGCVVGGGLVLLLAGKLGSLLHFAGEKQTGLLRLALLAVLLEPLTLLPLAVLQSRLQSRRFVLITFTQFLTLVGMRILLVAGFGWGVAGVLAATALTTGTFGLGLTALELWRGAAWPAWPRLRAMVRFALPFLPGGLCFFILQNGDRFFLRAFWGNEEVGTYSLGYKLALAVATFSLSPLYMVWSARLYEVAKSADAPLAFGRMFTRILAAYLFVGLGLSIFQDEVVRVVAGRAYAVASDVIAVVVLAGGFQAAASLMDAGFYVRGRTGLKLRITLEATLTMLVLYALLIPAYGSLGAALATLGGFMTLAARTWMVTQRVFPVRYEWRRVGCGLALAMLLWSLSRLLPAAWWAAPLRAALVLAWPLLLWHLGLPSAEERVYALDLWQRTANWIGGALRRRPRLEETRRAA